MSKQIIASRYADAVFALAQEKGLLDQVEQDLEILAQTLAGEPDLGLVLQNQRIDGEQKYELLKALFSGKFQDLTLDFLGLILAKNREEYLGDIILCFREAADDFRGIMEAEIRTALELQTSDKEKLAEQLAQATGKKVRLRYRVEPELIAGAVLRIGDKVMDGSIATRLKNLREELVG